MITLDEQIEWVERTLNRAHLSDYQTLTDILATLRAVKQAEPKVWTSWMQCPTHGPAKPNEWGCPDCVKEQREELRRIKQAAPQSPGREG